MYVMVSHITSNSIVYWTGWQQRKHQISPLLVLCVGNPPVTGDLWIPLTESTSCVLNHWKLDSLLKSFLRLKLLGHLKCNSPVTSDWFIPLTAIHQSPITVAGWFPSQRASIAESISMACHHHGSLSVLATEVPGQTSYMMYSMRYPSFTRTSISSNVISHMSGG